MNYSPPEVDRIQGILGSYFASGDFHILSMYLSGTVGSWQGFGIG